ncbi:uncharacterized protein BJX67DRAFT_230419 [Aspergillus lucknowensis]|uniref:Uncharacterized protein n=1 Tax=Aspergillus lucknowensis TaxID=176173 RepID=A0ABR4LH31_9EURO
MGTEWTPLLRQRPPSSSRVSVHCQRSLAGFSRSFLFLLPLRALFFQACVARDCAPAAIVFPSGSSALLLPSTAHEVALPVDWFCSADDMSGRQTSRIVPLSN